MLVYAHKSVDMCVYTNKHNLKYFYVLKSNASEIVCYTYNMFYLFLGGGLITRLLFVGPFLASVCECGVCTCVYACLCESGCTF